MLVHVLVYQSVHSSLRANTAPDFGQIDSQAAEGRALQSPSRARRSLCQ